MGSSSWKRIRGASDLAGVDPGSKVARAGLGDLPKLCAAEVLLHLGAGVGAAAAASDLAGVDPGGKVARAGLGDLPKLCAAEMLLRLGVPDICWLTRPYGASAVDFVWVA